MSDNGMEKRRNTFRGIFSDKIVFLGETTKIDVGANVFTHRNSSGEIDSLIIDSFYFFSEEEMHDIRRSHRLGF
jgi:hypothetical protein